MRERFRVGIEDAFAFVDPAAAARRELPVDHVHALVSLYRQTVRKNALMLVAVQLAATMKVNSYSLLYVVAPL